MTACRKLGKQRGISEAILQEIDTLHILIDNLMLSAIKENVPAENIKDILTEADFMLQKLWGFPQDGKYHTYYKKYQFKKQWAFKKFRCKWSGEVYEIPFDVREREFFQVGEAAIDVGVLNGYHRLVGEVEEVTQ
ncbi:hypothetical protein D3C85_392640 [compost metagenome]